MFYFLKLRLRIITRTEPISKINEHALLQVGSGDQNQPSKVNVADVLGAISKGNKEVAKVLKNSQKKKQTLEAPLEKPQALRVRVKIGLF